MLRNPSLAEIAEITGGELLSGSAHGLCMAVSTDTRTIQKGSLYIPLKGDRFDGHDFAEDAREAGALAMLVERELTVDLPQIKVEDTLRALADIAAWHRDQFNGHVVAVTGSAGKTTVKQLMGSVLSQRYKTLITQGNLNNHIGAPLTLLSLQPEHEAAMIELGASGVGEIAYTARLTRPEVGILTNVVPAHLEGFGSIDNIALTKGELIDAVTPSGTMVLNADDHYFTQWLNRATALNVISFGFNDRADVTAKDICESLTGSEFTLVLPDESVSVSLSLSGLHNVRNALAVAAAASSLGFSSVEIKAGLEQSSAVAGRLECCEGQRGQVIFNDAYNANPESFCAAIDVLKLAEGRRILVMGDMGELGDTATEMHVRVGSYAKDQNIECLVATGPLSKSAVEAFGENGHWFESREAVTEFLTKTTKSGDTLLVKGSRSAGMDQVVRSLADKEED